MTIIDIDTLSLDALTFAECPEIKANATIEFNTSTGQVIGQDDYGRPIIETGLEKEIIECYLTRTKSDRFINNQKNVVGTDQLSNYYYGRLVNPKTYVFPLRAVGDITITLNGRKGRFIELMELETPFAKQEEVSSNLGQRIECFIEFFEGN